MAEVEGELEPSPGGEQLRQQPLVAPLLDDDADRAEPVAEGGDAVQEERDGLQAREGELRREPEAVRHRRRPAAELLGCREPVAGRVQLDRVEALRVEREKLGRLQPAG